MGKSHIQTCGVIEKEDGWTQVGLRVVYIIPIKLHSIPIQVLMLSTRGCLYAGLDLVNLNK